MVPTTSDAVAASLAVAAALGIPVQDPDVVAEGYSVRVRLDPAPLEPSTPLVLEPADPGSVWAALVDLLDEGDDGKDQEVA